MKKLNQWVKTHPYKAVLFSWIFAMTAACMAVVNEHGFWCVLVIYAFFIVLWVMIFSRDILKLPLILAFAMAVPTNAAEPPREVSGPVGIGVGVVVICAGGYCVYKLVKFCQRKFPKESSNTNSPPAFASTGDEESAASWNYGSIGSCDPTLTPGSDFLAVETSGTVFIVDISIDAAGGITTRTSALGESATQSWADFQAEVASHGIQITGNSDGSQYFSTNRMPSSPSDVAIAFDSLTKTVELGDGPMKLIEIERSRDLYNWTPFLRTRVGYSRGLRIEDASVAVNMFYRVKVSDAL